MRRRALLQAALMAATAGWLPVGRSAWAAAPQATAARRRLVVVMLRGAVDGLSVVAPVFDADYRRARPTLALGLPGSEGGALGLDGRFGLHPALAPLLPLWSADRLAFVHACGSPDPTRSHFDAQDDLETATPGVHTTPDGWLNRLLGVLPPERDAAPARALSIGPVLPRIVAGPQPVATMAAGAAASRPRLLDRPRVASAFDALYAGDDRLSQAYRASRAARREVMASLDGDEVLAREMQAASNGAPLPAGFADDAARLAGLMRHDPRVQLAFIALGGWDTHANQAAALAGRLQPLGQGLAVMAERLGPVFDDTVVLVMSEFGRTVRENGNRGTDHGHGNAMWLLGGGVAGGRVHGRWPGLDDGALHEGRDLAVTTDFRSVLAQVGQRHLGLGDRQMAAVLPGFDSPQAPLLFRG